MALLLKALLLFHIICHQGSFGYDWIAPMPMPALPVHQTSAPVASNNPTFAPTSAPPGSAGDSFMRTLPMVERPQLHFPAEMSTASPTVAGAIVRQPTGEGVDTRHDDSMADGTTVRAVNSSLSEQGQTSPVCVSNQTMIDVSDSGDVNSQTTVTAVDSETTREQTTHHPQYPFLVSSFQAKVRLAEYTGEIHVSKTREFKPDETISVQLTSLTEKALNDAGDELVQSSQTADLMDGKVMRVSMTEPPQDGLYPGSNATARTASFEGVVTAKSSRWSKMVVIICKIKIDIYIFTSIEKIANGNSTVHTYPGLVQIDTSIIDHHDFCTEVSEDWMSHCLQRNTHSLEYKVIASPIIPQTCRKDVRGKNFIYFGGVGYVIMKQKVVVDNGIFPISHEEFIMHNRKKPWVGIHLTVPKFETIVTTKINIELEQSTCNMHQMESLIPRTSQESMRDLNYFPVSVDQQNDSTPSSHATLRCSLSISLNLTAFILVVLTMYFK